MSYIRDHNIYALAAGRPTATELTADVEADIRTRWVDGDPYGDDCGEHWVRPHRHHEVLEGLRHARFDIATLLAEVERLRTTDLVTALRVEFAEAHADGASSNDIVQLLDDWLVKHGQPTVLYA